MLIIMGLTIGLGSLLGGDSNGGFTFAFLVGMGIVLILMGFVMFRQEVTMMPLKIYENGFTLINVPLNQGWRREDQFLTWERLNKVKLESSEMYNIMFRKITMSYDQDQSQELNYNNLDDPFKVMKALKKYVPEKMDEGFKVYVGDENERKVISRPIPQTVESFRWIMPLLIALFMFFMIGVFLGMTGFSFKLVAILFQLVLLAVFSPIVILMLYMTFMLETRTQKNIINTNAKTTAYGIEFEKTALGKLIRNVRTKIPYNEIKIVRMKVDPFFYSHQAEFETVGGERFLIPFGVYQKISKRKDFKLVDFDYKNKHPGLSKGPVITTNTRGVVVLILLLALSIFIGPLLSFDIMGFFEEIELLCISLIFAILLPLLMITYWLMARRSRLGQDLFAHDKGISIPNAPEKFQFISKPEFVSASVEKDLLGYYCELNSVSGQLKLPQASAEKLLAAGYPVENAEGLGIIPMKGSFGAPEPGEPVKEPHEDHEVDTETELPASIAPGSLILEEDKETVVAKKGKMYRYGYIFSAVAVICLIIPVLFNILVPDLCLVYYIFFIVLIPVFVILAIVLFRVGSKIKPIRIYENGISFPEVMMEDGYVFVPYGRIKTHSEVKMPIWGEVVNFHLEGTTKFIIPKATPGFMTLFDEIKGKLGDPKYDCKDFTLFPKSMFVRLAVIIYSIIFILGYITGFIMNWPPIVGNYQGMVATSLIEGSAVTILMLAYAIGYLEFKKKEKQFKGHVSIKRAGSLFLIVIVLFCFGLAANVPSIEVATIIQDEPPGTWAFSNGSIENSTIS